MASDSRPDPGVGVDVPADLDEWLDERAASLGVDRSDLVVQVLSSYHAAATLDGELDAAQLLDLDAADFVDVETAVAESVDDQVGDALSDRLDEVVAERVAAELDDRLDERLATAVEDPLDELDAAVQAKIEDVRERVVQVKREADGKAPSDHTHDELARVDELDARVDDLAGSVAALRDDLDERLDDTDERTADLDERVDDALEKLNRVAWVVSDLKEETTGRDAHEQAVDRIKRAAAQEGVATATCERCDGRVHVALLTDPECPHCNATVSDVRPAGGIFRKKGRLVAASQLESGEGSERP